jgi:hypothetical protein
MQHPSGNIRYSESLYYEGVPAVAFWADPPAPPVLDADRGATQFNSLAASNRSRRLGGGDDLALPPHGIAPYFRFGPGCRSRKLIATEQIC